MTHKSDCTLLPWAEWSVDAVADCFYHGVKKRLGEQGRQDIDHWSDIDPVEEPCHKEARGLGMEFLGSGVARATFAVTPDPTFRENDHGDTVTPYDSCVIKFARYSPRGATDGKVQNRDEIEQFQTLPESLTWEHDGDPPLVNPIKDYDEENGLWITQPYCPPPGDWRQVKAQLKERGFIAKDLDADNTGTYPNHGGNAVIDYGMPIKRQGAPDIDRAEKIQTALRDMGAIDIDRDVMARGRIDIEFYPDPDLPGEERPVNKSVIRINENGRTDEMSIVFPGFPTERVPSRAVSDALDDIEIPVRSDYVVRRLDHRYNAGRHVSGEIYIDASPAPMGREETVDRYEGIISDYNEAFAHLADPYGHADGDGGGDGTSGQSLDEWRSYLLSTGATKIDARMRSFDPDIKYHEDPPLGLGEAGEASEIDLRSPQDVLHWDIRLGTLTLTDNAVDDAMEQAADAADAAAQAARGDIRVEGVVRPRGADGATREYMVIYDIQGTATTVGAGAARTAHQEIREHGVPVVPGAVET